MQSLEKRLIELERTAHQEELTLVIRFVSPGNMDTEVTDLKDHRGAQSWSRAVGENEADFIQRASKEVQRLNGVATLIQTNKEDLNAQA